MVAQAPLEYSGYTNLVFTTNRHLLNHCPVVALISRYKHHRHVQNSQNNESNGKFLGAYGHSVKKYPCFNAGDLESQCNTRNLFIRI